MKYAASQARSEHIFPIHPPLLQSSARGLVNKLCHSIKQRVNFRNTMKAGPLGGVFTNPLEKGEGGYASMHRSKSPAERSIHQRILG